LTIVDANQLTLNSIRAESAEINIKELTSGVLQFSGSATMNAEVIQNISVSGSDVRLEADDKIDGVSVVSTSLTVRGNNSVVLVNTVIAGVRGSATFRLVDLLLPFGDGIYSVNGVPFGPDEIIPVLNSIQSNLQVALSAIGAAEALVDSDLISLSSAGINLNLAGLFSLGSGDDDEDESEGEDDQVASLSIN
jgi:hypothetical protein